MIYPGLKLTVLRRCWFWLYTFIALLWTLKWSLSAQIILSRCWVGTYRGKWAHMQLIRKCSSTVISVLWATLDWSWPKEWNQCVWADPHFKKKERKVQAENVLSNLLPRILVCKENPASVLVCSCNTAILVWSKVCLCFGLKLLHVVTPKIWVQKSSCYIYTCWMICCAATINRSGILSARVCVCVCALCKSARGVWLWV